MSWYALMGGVRTASWSIALAPRVRPGVVAAGRGPQVLLINDRKEESRNNSDRKVVCQCDKQCSQFM